MVLLLPKILFELKARVHVDALEVSFSLPLSAQTGPNLLFSLRAAFVNAASLLAKESLLPHFDLSDLLGLRARSLPVMLY